MIKALIFDFDGLILDTETPDLVSWQEVYRAHGQELSLEQWALCIGTAEAVFDPYADLENLLGQPLDRDAIRRERLRYEHKLIAAESPRPGVAEYLVEAKQLALQVGVASSSPREWVVGHLARLEMLPFFDCIHTGDDVEHTKPDPALYRLALESLGVHADEGIAFEDSPNGIRAAKRAGLFCVAVPNAVTRQLSLDQADLQLTSMAEMSLHELLTKRGMLQA